MFHPSYFVHRYRKSHIQRRAIIPDATSRRKLQGEFKAGVDAADYEWFRQWRSHLAGCRHAARNENGKTILMHHQIMDPPEGRVVDHADGNKANTYRFNLRVCTKWDNQHNRRKCRNTMSRFKDVSCNKRARKWFSGFGFDGRVVPLGYFSDEIEAAGVYDRAAVEYFCQFARLNFPEEWPPERRAQVHAEWQEAQKRESRKAGTKENKTTAYRGKRRRGGQGGSRATGHEPQTTKASAHAETRGTQKKPARGCSRRPGDLKTEKGELDP